MGGVSARRRRGGTSGAANLLGRQGSSVLELFEDRGGSLSADYDRHDVGGGGKFLTLDLSLRSLAVHAMPRLPWRAGKGEVIAMDLTLVTG